MSLALPLRCGCQIPQDTDGTLDRVKGGTVRVGVSESDPWVIFEPGAPEPSGGVEVKLIRRFASGLDARIEWVQGSEEELVDAIKEGSLDLLAAGLTKKLPVDIVHDGWKNVRAAVHDLMDARPRRHDAREFHPIVQRMNVELTKQN